jgi:hypothetical protein
MHKIKNSVMALLLVTFAAAEIPESAHAAVASPVTAAPITTSQSEDSNLAKAAWRYCRRSYWGRVCGPWHYGYRYRRHYYWRRRYY